MTEILYFAIEEQYLLSHTAVQITAKDGMTFATVLCVEGRRTRFAACMELNSCSFEVVAATNMLSAIVALKAIPRISAVVISEEGELIESCVQSARQMEAIRPGMPKVVVGPLSDDERRHLPALNLSNALSVSSLNDELRRVVLR